MSDTPDNSTILVSVIVPVFNRQRFIARCLRSIADQDGIDRSRVEILVIDDGSTDRTPQVVRELDLSPARLVYVPIAHTGQPGTVRNEGLRRAAGRYVAYCDSDDYWLPHHLATAMQEFRKDPALMMVSTHWALACFHPQDDGSIRTVYQVPPHPMHLANTNCRVHRRQCLAKVGLFNTDRWGEDKDFFERIEQAFPCRKLPVVTNVNGYIVGGNNITYEYDGRVRQAFFHGGGLAGLPQIAEAMSGLRGRPALKKLAFLLAVLGLFFLARWPLYARPLDYEEGIFADLFVHRPPGPNYCLLARVDGRNIYAPLQHPAGLYETVRLGGRLLGWAIPPPPAPEETVSFRLRLVFSLCQAVVWLAVVWLVCFGSFWSRHRLLLGLLAAVIVSPIAVVSSRQLQIDGSVGVLMNGLVAGAVLWATRQDTPGPRSLALLLGSAFVLGLGKQEWTIALLAALACWGVYLALLRRPGRAVGGHVLAALAMAGALLAGNAASYALDPVNYVGGLDVLRRVTASHTVVNTAGTPWLEVARARTPMLLTPLGLLAALGVLLAARRGQAGPWAVLLILYGVALFVPFFLSTWEVDGRYFAPSVVALTMAIVAVFPRQIARKAGAVLAVLVAAMALHGAVFFARQIARPPAAPAALARPDRPDAVPMLPTGAVWNRPDVDFVGNGLSREDARQLLRSYGKTLYLPP